MSEVLESATLLDLRRRRTHRLPPWWARASRRPWSTTWWTWTVPAADTRCPAEDADDGFRSIRDEVVSQFVEAGLPEPIAECVVDGILDEIGEDELNRLVLSGDPTELTRPGDRAVDQVRDGRQLKPPRRRPTSGEQARPAPRSPRSLR